MSNPFDPAWSGGTTQPTTLSGTYNFFPSLGEVTLNALSRIRLRGPMVLAEHLHQSFMEANLLQSEWSNRGPNLWTVGQLPIVPTVPGVATYTIPSTIIMLTNVTIGWGNPETEITITPITRQEYTMFPVKTTQGRPTSYFFDRTIAPTITLWPTPDQVYNLHLWGFGQQMDAQMRANAQMEVPYRWLDACCSGLAYRLSRHYANDLEAQRKSDYDEAYKLAAVQDTEDGHIYIMPMIGGYYD